MKFIGLIPARYDSTRFPGKPLVVIDGKTMIQRVYEQAKQALDEVCVVTDDERIYHHVHKFGGKVVMSPKECRNGTERCAAAVSANLWDSDYIDLNTIIINIQGDQPYVDPSIIRSLMQCYEKGNPDIVTVVTPLTQRDRNDPNCVKAYLTDGGWVHNFLRHTIYHPGLKVFKHIGIYAYPARVLLDLVQLEETESERATNLEQLRWLQKYRILCVRTLTDVISVDTPEDLYKFKKTHKEIIRDVFKAEAEAVHQIPISGDYYNAITVIRQAIQRGGKLITSGVGKAGQVAHDIATTFCSTGTPAVFLHPGEAQHGDLGVLQENDVLLLVSNSGATRELIELVDLVKEMYCDIPIIVITGSIDSPLWDAATVQIWTGHPPEVCPLGLTPTTSTTVMGVIGDALVVLMMQEINFTHEEYAKRHHGGYLGQKAREDGTRKSRAIITKRFEDKSSKSPRQPE